MLQCQKILLKLCYDNVYVRPRFFKRYSPQFRYIILVRVYWPLSSHEHSGVYLGVCEVTEETSCQSCKLVLTAYNLDLKSRDKLLQTKASLSILLDHMCAWYFVIFPTLSFQGDSKRIFVSSCKLDQRWAQYVSQFVVSLNLLRFTLALNQNL